MIKIKIEPMDTLLFRDSRPFSAGEDTMAEFNFPSPLTFYGAIGNAILNATGGVNHKKFIDPLFDHPVLGKYDSELKNTRLKIKGPFLHRNGIIFFPPPSNLWVYGQENAYIPKIAIPYDNDYKWDLKKANLKPLRLPEVQNSKPKPLGKFISYDVLSEYLSGNLLRKSKTFEGRSEDEFFMREVRYGHEISQDSQTVKDSCLYSATHIRFREKESTKNKTTGYILIADGIEENDLQDKIIYLGGERRKAIISLFLCDVKNLVPEQPEVLNKIKSTKKFFIYLATPAIFADGWCMKNNSENYISYLFSWDQIPGNDSGRLIEFIGRNYGIDWVKTAKIDKIDNGVIRVSTEINSLSLTINPDKTRLNLTIDDGRRYEFVVKMENGQLNIYNLDFVGAELIGAAVNKPQYISGWRITENMIGEPRAIKKAVPSGSVYFYEAKLWADKQFEDMYKKYHFGKSLSDEYPSAGFGIGLIGCW